MNITAIKTSTMQSLQRQYNDSTVIAAKAQSAYDSYANKAQLFQGLYAQATNDVATVGAQWTQFLTLKSSLNSLNETSENCDLVAQVTNEQIKRLVKKWEQVMQQTLEATDAINLASTLINKRKASNALISSDLVADSTQAANNAVSTVTLVINALTAALNTLTVSGQATNSSNLTGLSIDLTSAVFLASDNDQSDSTYTPLEVSLKALYDKVTATKQAVNVALENANEEMNDSKEALNMANANVVAAQAALAAAQAAVNA
jgi:hypothetical protein